MSESNDDKIFIEETANSLASKLELSKSTAKIFVECAVKALDISEKIEELSDKDTAQNVHKIRRTIVSTLVGWLLDIPITENAQVLAELTEAYMDACEDILIREDSL